jgi:hypothetical protein
MPHRHVHAVDRDAPATLSSADQHAHGMRLVDQDERVPAPIVALPALPAGLRTILVQPLVRARDRRSDEDFRPTGRAPPSIHSRAPPHIA